MATTTIGGVEFNVPPPEEVKHTRGRKSPKGDKTGLPFNVFCWELLNKNAIGDAALTDSQILAVLGEEFSSHDTIMRQVRDTPGELLSRLRSHFNQNILVTGAKRTDKVYEVTSPCPNQPK